MKTFYLHIKTVIKITYLLSSLIILSSCQDNSDDNKETRETILVYLAGDNSLSNEIGSKTKALYEEWEPSMGNLIILADNKDSHIPVLIKAKRKNGEIVSDTVKIYKNTNSASSELLHQVIMDTQEKWPSKKYGMIIFSHGSSWFPTNSLFKKEDYNKSITIDNDSYMEIEDFASAIPDSTFDFMIFETCYSANIELMYALRKKTHYSIASSAEILSPGFTNQYKKDLPLLYKSSPDLVGFAKDFFDNRNKTYNSCTISVIDNTKLEELATLTKKIAPQIQQSEISSIQHFERTQSNTNLIFDLGEYLNISTENKELKKEIKSVFSDVILMEMHTESFFINWDDQTFMDIKSSSGLTVYIPQKTLSKFNEEYKKTTWSKATE